MLEDFSISTRRPQSNGRMVDAVEHICFYHRIMYHIFKNDTFADLQFMIETPGTHIVSAQAGITSEPIDKRSLLSHHRPANGRLIRHFQTVGHVTGKADVKNGGTDTTALDNIYHLGSQYPGLPGESRTGLKDDAQMRITFL